MRIYADYFFHAHLPPISIYAIYATFLKNRGFQDIKYYMIEVIYRLSGSGELKIRAKKMLCLIQKWPKKLSKYVIFSLYMRMMRIEAQVDALQKKHPHGQV